MTLSLIPNIWYIHCELGLIVIFLLISFLIRLAYIINYNSKKKSKIPWNTLVSTMIIFGSGGHTTEMIRLIEELKIDVHKPVFFVFAMTDHTSLEKIASSKLKINPDQIFQVYRSREVKQSWVTSIFTSILSLFQCLYITVKYQPKLIICNGPGTCVPICMAAYFCKFLGIYQPVIIFVESFCRVKSLSLTGKLLYYIVDRFIVQWPQLKDKYKRVEYIGKIC